MSLLVPTLWFTAEPVYGSYPVAQLPTLGAVHFILGTPLLISAIGMRATAALPINLWNGPGTAPSR